MGDLRVWHDGPLPEGVKASAQRLAESEDVRHVALMPDAHLAEDVCVGAVVATTGTPSRSTRRTVSRGIDGYGCPSAQQWAQAVAHPLTSTWSWSVVRSSSLLSWLMFAVLCLR